MPTYTDSTGITWNYTLSGGNATIRDGTLNAGSATTDGTGLSGAITIPSTIPYGVGDASYNVTGIGNYAFQNCSSLTSIDFSGTQVTTIGRSAFQSCTSLTSIIIPNSLTTIDYYVFQSCSSLETIDLGNSLETIDFRAFYNCSNLTSITIPDSVTAIGSQAFSNIASSFTVFVKDVDPNKTVVDIRALIDGVINGTATYLSLTSTPLAPSLSNVSFAYDGTTKYSATVVSNDLEGDNLTFDLSGTNATSFQITNYDACNNALLESKYPWDLNAPFAYSLTIKATDSDDLSAISLVSIAKTATADDLSTNNISGSTLKTVADQVSVSPKDLYDAGYTLEDLYDASYSATEARSAVQTEVTVIVTTMDSYSDAWDGHKMTVASVNGFSKEFAGPLDGSATLEETINLSSGDYTVTWSSGNYAGEKTVTITSADGTVLFYEEPSGGGVTNGSFTIVGSIGITSQQLADAGYDADAVLAAGYTQAEVDATLFIALSSTTIDKDAAIGTVIGDFQEGATYTVDDTTNFEISGNQLLSNVQFDYETTQSYDITITASDGSLNSSQNFTIQVVDVNEVPTNITLSSTTIDENAAIGTVIADLSCNDPDGDFITYTVNDTTNFEISGSQLLSKEQFDFETKATYNITITASDGTDSTSADFTITVNNVNEVPTNITLSSTTIDENVASGTVIGDLSCNDPEGDNITYTVDDTTNFEISGNQLLSNESFDFEITNSYNIAITASDGSLNSNQYFTITVNNVNEVPTNITLSSTTIDENAGADTIIGDLSCNDPEGDNITYTVDDTTNFKISGSLLLSKVQFDYETTQSYNITITASDGLLNSSAIFTITVNNVVETASDLYNANVQGAILKTTADNDGITTQQLLDAGYTVDNLIAAGICFPADTPVNTDQGTVAIDKIDVSKHTIRGKRIVAITQTITHEKHIVCIKKDAFAKNVPSQDTLTTQNHCFFYNGNMVKAKHLVNKLDNVVLVKYDGCILYNVLQDKHETMVINNLIAETFYPEHGIAKMYRYFSENKVSPEMQYNIMVQVANEYKKKNLTK